jgi:hypothetical protein
MHRSESHHDTNHGTGRGSVRGGASAASRIARAYAPHARRAAACASLALVVALPLAGCLGKPEIEDRWTRIDVSNANVTPNQHLAAGSTAPIALRATITYRAILTGFAVAELRASTVPIGQVVVAPDADREPMARDIDNILANSVTLGRATRAVTGWDHLMQPIDFAFDGRVPSGTDSSGAPVGLFLLCYLAQGEEMERADGSDTLIVTPFDSIQYEILPVGIELEVQP